MKSITNFLFATLLILLALDSSAQAYRPVIDLGTLGGPYNFGSIAYSVNNKGQIVGYAYDSSGAPQHACLFDKTGGGNNIDLGTLGGDRSEAYSINNNGQIVGGADNSSGWWGACLFDSTGGGANKQLGVDSANYINDNGQIVGGSGNPARAFLLDPDGYGNYNYINLGGRFFPGWEISSASSINNNGQIVGGSSLFGTPRAFLLDPEGGGNYNCIELGGYFSGALSINDSGQIVGYARNSSPTNRACLFDSTGGGANIDLGTLGGDYSEAHSINNNGQIVGDGANESAGYYGYRACLFDPTGQGNNIDLNTLIDPSSRWILQRAYSINNNGWIVGYGTNPDGYTRAYLLTPEPATVCLLGLGALSLIRRKR